MYHSNIRTEYKADHFLSQILADPKVRQNTDSIFLSRNDFLFFVPAHFRDFNRYEHN